MMPSRGLHAARGTAPRLYQHQCRNLSSLPSRIHRPTPLRPTQLSKPTSLALPSIRHASTTPTPTASPIASPPPPPAAETLPAPNVDTITLDSLDLQPDISALPEKIGYLHQIGLDYGWGPTSILEWVLEHIHVFSGMPWWGSIAATAVVLRLVAFPAYLKASDSNARQSALVTVTKPITQRMTEMQKAGKSEEVMLCFQQLQAIRKRAGIKWSDQFAPLLIQGVFGFCGFKLLRAAASLPVPGFLDGGFLWLSDLTVPDPYLLMPAIMAGSVYALMKLGGESGSMNADQMAPGMKNVMFYGMPAMIMVVMAWQPGALCVWFTASGALGMGQALLLQRPAVRKYFGLAPLYKPTAEEAKGASLMGSYMEGMMGTRPAAKKDAFGAKNASFMRPQWQAPNLHTRAGEGKIIDVTPSKPTAGTGPMGVEQPPPSQKDAIGGFVKGIGNQYKDFKAGWMERAETTREERTKKALKRRAQEYEERARNRKGQ